MQFIVFKNLINGIEANTGTCLLRCTQVFPPILFECMGGSCLSILNLQQSSYSNCKFGRQFNRSLFVCSESVLLGCFAFVVCV